jgi:hypothetical protein
LEPVVGALAYPLAGSEPLALLVAVGVAVGVGVRSGRSIMVAVGVGPLRLAMAGK